MVMKFDKQEAMNISNRFKNTVIDNIFEAIEELENLSDNISNSSLMQEEIDTFEMDIKNIISKLKGE